MQLYKIRLLDSNGKVLTKIVEVDRDEDIQSYVAGFGANVIGVSKLPPYAKLLRRKPKIKTSEVVEVIDNLHMIVKSGMPVNSGLMDLAADSDNPAMADMLNDLSQRVQSGLTFSKAMAKYEHVFTGMVVNLIRIGEETGQLDNTLKNAAEHLKKISDLRTKTKSALIYPSFAFVAMILVMVFWLIVVMPKMIEAFKSFNIDLPPTTRFIMWLSDFLQSYIVFIAVAVVGMIILNTFLRKTAVEYRFATDRLITRLPVFGHIVKNYNYAFIAEYIRLMISAGLPLYTALNIMEESLPNLVYKRSIGSARDMIASGRSFSAALAEQKMYPKIITRMVGIGEQTGNLDNQLGNVSEYYYYKVDTIANNISKMIEPIVIGVVGVFMLVIMIGLMGPIFTLISSMPT
ncbi:type II secretion system F family protein [Seleniivibrio woodruffii]|uniref:General secretion pathway protein F/type IV pilus assembly protein PilC n=2 Tax=Seleniivibrio woodruffii TaxID=1078050 RepID=A0A4R1K5G6_9BACT|nr:type II secretion system F family protein [Seleniivibrio woodruffii]TCK59394.1 general secretion pathway protein F/type IV pilus assembly protein PilC [Seleniivibrio woodruffii]TVZ35565.1 general secretion pathway protein F/type IV pilus assembly protein PilC [Seleniivibrio woodruffii]